MFANYFHILPLIYCTEYVIWSHNLRSSKREVKPSIKVLPIFPDDTIRNEEVMLSHPIFVISFIKLVRKANS